MTSHRCYAEISRVLVSYRAGRVDCRLSEAHSNGKRAWWHFLSEGHLLLSLRSDPTRLSMLASDPLGLPTPEHAMRSHHEHSEKTAARGNCRATSVAVRSSPDLMKAAVRLPAPPTRSRAP